MPELVKQPGSEPTRKTTAAISAGSFSVALSTILTWLLKTYTNVEVPAPVEVAIAALITVGAAYFTHERGEVQ